MSLYKGGQGKHDECSSSRGILLADVLGKRLQAYTRKKLQPLAAEYFGETHAGVLPGLGTDFINHIARTFLSLQQAMGHSAAALFVDISNAFYSVVRSQCMPTDEVSDE